MPRSRLEWLAIIAGLITILIVLLYCGWRIQITQQWLHDHRDYIQLRDAAWKPVLDEIEAHLIRQDKDAAELRRIGNLVIGNQQKILEHVIREDAERNGKP